MTAEQTEPTAEPVAKKKRKPVPPSTTALAFREYERVSYYLATQDDFNFDLDDAAREDFYLHVSMTSFPDMSASISQYAKERLNVRNLKSIPNGDHIEGLALRTEYRERKLGKKAEKQAAPKKDAPKPEIMDVTPNMQRLLKKKGKSRMDEAADLS